MNCEDMFGGGVFLNVDCDDKSTGIFIAVGSGVMLKGALMDTT